MGHHPFRTSPLGGHRTKRGAKGELFRAGTKSHGNAHCREGLRLERVVRLPVLVKRSQDLLLPVFIIRQEGLFVRVRWYQQGLAKWRPPSRITYIWMIDLDPAGASNEVVGGVSRYIVPSGLRCC